MELVQGGGVTGSSWRVDLVQGRGWNRIKLECGTGTIKEGADQDGVRGWTWYNEGGIGSSERGDLVQGGAEQDQARRWNWYKDRGAEQDGVRGWTWYNEGGTGYKYRG